MCDTLHHVWAEGLWIVDGGEVNGALLPARRRGEAQLPALVRRLRQPELYQRIGVYARVDERAGGVDGRAKDLRERRVALFDPSGAHAIGAPLGDVHLEDGVRNALECHRLARCAKLYQGPRQVGDKLAVL